MLFRSCKCGKRKCRHTILEVVSEAKRKKLYAKQIKAGLRPKHAHARTTHHA